MLFRGVELLAMTPPGGSVLEIPVGQRVLEADIAPDFFGFEPLVAKDLVAFRLEFPVKSCVRE